MRWTTPCSLSVRAFVKVTMLIASVRRRRELGALEGVG